MENTLENKAKFFAQYYGVNAHTIKMSAKDLVVDVCSATFMKDLNEDYLYLKPLSTISDEDKTHIEMKIGQDLSKMEFQVAIFTHCLFTAGYTLSYLRSKGYALPFMGLSVESQISYGWVKLSEV